MSHKILFSSINSQLILIIANEGENDPSEHSRQKGKRSNLVIGHLGNNVKIANIHTLTHHISNYPK